MNPQQATQVPPPQEAVEPHPELPQGFLPEQTGQGGRRGGLARPVDPPGMNCIKIGLPGKLILSKRKGLREVLFS